MMLFVLPVSIDENRTSTGSSGLGPTKLSGTKLQANKRGPNIVRKDLFEIFGRDVAAVEREARCSGYKSKSINFLPIAIDDILKSKTEGEW